MDALINSIQFVSGPLTLIAFLGVVVLAIYQRSVKDERGLEFLFTLFRDKLTKQQFYQLMQQIISKAFWLCLVIFVSALLAYVVVKIIGEGGLTIDLSEGDSIDTGSGDDVVVTGGSSATVSQDPEQAGDLIVSAGAGNRITSDSGNDLVIAGKEGEQGRITLINSGLRADGASRLHPQYRIDVIWNERSTQPLRDQYQLRNICTVQPARCADVSGQCQDFELICPLYQQYCSTNSSDRAPLERQIQALEESPEDFCGDNIEICANDAAFCQRKPDVAPIPEAVYGFWYAWLLNRNFQDSDSWSATAEGAAQAELHKRPSGVYALAGFTDDNAAKTLTDPARVESVTVVIYTAPHQAAKNLVSVPLPRVEGFVSGRQREMDAPDAIELVVW
jgi:hypothetical protein